MRTDLAPEQEEDQPYHYQPSARYSHLLMLDRSLLQLASHPSRANCIIAKRLYSDDCNFATFFSVMLLGCRYNYQGATPLDQLAEQIVRLHRLVDDPIDTSPHPPADASELFSFFPAEWIRDDTVPYIRRCLSTEVESSRREKRYSTTYSTALRLSEEKGGAAYQLVQSLLGIQPDEEGWRLGRVLQLIDNYLDVDEDRKLGITTEMTVLDPEQYCEHRNYIERLIRAESYYTEFLQYLWYG